MSFASYLTTANSSGLFELKNDGTVLYSRFRQDSRLINTDPEMIGQNFFEEIAGFENVKALRQIFNNFVKSRQFTHNFVFDCRLGEQTVPVRVMMVHAYENNYSGQDDIVILDIRNGAF